MFDHLRLTVAPIVRGVILRNLGRINVICGRNNSGKSTLLAAIATSSSRSCGITFQRDEQELIAHRAAYGTGWRGGLEHAHENLVFGAICIRVLSSRPMWFRSDDSLFGREVAKLYQEDRDLARWSLDAPAVSSAFREQFKKDPETILLPPKRALQLNRSITLSEPVTPEGEGLLNFLFLAKNQPASHGSRLLYDQISSAFEAISAGYRLEIFANRENTIQLQFARADGGWIPAASCGLGLQDLLIILYFALADGPEVVLIEEPESHLHPDMQRRLLSFLRENTEKQYFVTTHSNVFVNNAFVDRVFLTSFSNEIVLSDETSRASMLDDLGYSVTDNLVSDLVILVEGPSDTPVIEELLKKDGLYGRFEIKIWPLGGDIMDQLDLSVFAEKYRMIALIDADPGSSRIRERFQHQSALLGIPTHRLSRYSIENYFTLQALREVFPNQIPLDLSTLDGSRSVEQQIGFNVKRSNRKLAQAMSLSDIEDTDLGAFIQAVRQQLGA